MNSYRYSRRYADDAPAGWQAGTTESRLAQAGASTPRSYNPKARTVDVVIATGYRVRRWYGFEELAISDDAIDLRRVSLGQCRLLDSHNQHATAAALGTVISARVERGELVGSIRFNDSARGREAEQSVARGEITGISAGYRVTRLVRVDDAGADDDVYRAEQWELLEASLVSVPADPYAGARSLSTGLRLPSGRLNSVDAARVRMEMAARIMRLRP